MRNLIPAAVALLEYKPTHMHTKSGTTWQFVLTVAVQINGEWHHDAVVYRDNNGGVFVRLWPDWHRNFAVLR